MMAVQQINSCRNRQLRFPYSKPIDLCRPQHANTEMWLVYTIINDYVYYVMTTYE